MTQTQNQQLTGFGVTARVEGYGLGERFGSEDKGCVGAKIKLTDDRPSQITVVLQAEAQDGISSFAVHQEEPYELPGNPEFPFSPPITWEPGEGGIWTPSVPDSRESEVSFVNIVLLDGDAHFLDTQWSATVDGNYLYLMGQKVYAGWMREVNAELTFFPSEPAFAHPGPGYREIWQARGGNLAFLGNFANQIALGMGGQLSTPQVAEWKLPETTAQVPDGWVIAKMAYFSPITRTGLALGTDGAEYHLRKQNLSGFERPVQIPGHGALVLLKPGTQREGFSRIPVRICRPFIERGQRDRRFAGKN